jgi:hypothetical protein
MASAPLATQPCDLKCPCKVIDAKLLLDYFNSTFVKLGDTNGSELYLSYTDGNVHFTSAKNTHIDSQPGSPQEQCALKTLKDLVAAIYDPARDYNTGENGAKRAAEQRAVLNLIHVLERRCEKKTTS